MTDMDYRIDIAGRTGEISISPVSPLKLLSGGIKGFDSTDFDVATGAYANDNGGYIKKRRYAERLMELVFEITESDGEWRRRILSVVNPGCDCTITAKLYGTTRRITAVPVDRITFEQDSFYDRTTVKLRFMAPDPFFMSEETKTGAFIRTVPMLTFPMNFYKSKSGKRAGVVPGYVIHTETGNAPNMGDVACGVVITVKAKGGSVVNPRITKASSDGTGEEFIGITATLADGDELVIDTRRRQKGVKINGESRLIFDWKSTFFSLDVGDNMLTIDAAGGKEYMAVRYEYVP
ncbi:MAG: phage tail family protein, partial [Ruminococcaceae bacterium]|nr:phage tail family protein [Oscillospiraceae bacterium]